MIRQPCENIGEPGLRVDIIHFAGFNERQNRGCPVSSCIRPYEGPIFSAYCYTTNGSFGGVVAEANSSIIQEARERAPAGEAVVDGLRSLTF